METTTAERKYAPSYAYFGARTGLILFMAVLAFFHVWTDLFSIGWNDAESSHILLVPFVAGWLVWRRLNRLNWNGGEGQKTGIILILAAIILHEVGMYQQMLVLWHASAVVGLIGGISLAFGVASFRILSPPLLVLFCMIPVPGLVRQQISMPMQVYSAMATEWIMQLFGSSVERTGCTLHLHGVCITVAEACNGMRMVFAVMLVVYALCFAYPLRFRTRLLLLVLSPILILAFNILRLLLTVGIFTYSSEAGMAFHESSGWVIVLGFIIVLACFTGKPEPEPTLNVARVTDSTIRRSSLTTWVGLTILLFSFGVNYHLTPSRDEVVRHQQTVERLLPPPYVMDDWVSVDDELHPDVLALLKPIAAVKRRYRNLKTGQRVSLVAIATGRARDLSGHEPGICFTGQGWTKLAQRPAEWTLAGEGIHGRYYVFSINKSGFTINNSVTSVMIVPGGLSTGDTRDVAEAASDFRLEPFGAMTIQLQSNDQFSEQDWHNLSRDFVSCFLPVIREYEKCVGNRTGSGPETNRIPFLGRG